MGLNKVIVASFKRGFEEKCFQLITKSYVSAMETKVIKLNWDENDITSELHQHIQDNPLRLEWNIHSNVEKHLPKDEIKKEKGFAAKLPRIDLTFAVISSKLEYVESPVKLSHSFRIKLSRVNQVLKSIQFVC